MNNEQSNKGKTYSVCLIEPRLVLGQEVTKVDEHIEVVGSDSGGVGLTCRVQHMLESTHESYVNAAGKKHLVFQVPCNFLCSGHCLIVKCR